MSRAPRPLTPKQSVAHYFGWELRRQRQAAGYKLEAFARRVGKSASYVSQVELGEARCTAAFAAACDLVLQTGGLFSNLWPSVDREWERSAQDALPLDDLLPLMVELLKMGGSDMERRALLRLVAALGASASTSGLNAQPSPEVWERLSLALAKPSALDAATVASLEACTEGFFLVEEHLPARRLDGGLRLHLEELTSLLHGAPAALRGRLAAAAGATAALAGWVAFDLGDGRRADALYRTALQAAGQAKDKALRACVLGYQSYLASSQGRSKQAVELLVAAQRDRLGSTNATTRAWLAAREAEERAALGDHTAALAALARAKDSFVDAHPEHERPWTRFFDRSRLGSMEVATLARLDRPAAELRDAVDGVLAALGQEGKKKRSIALADVAAAYFQQGDAEQGCHFALEAHAIASRTACAWGRQRLRHLSRHLAACTHVPAARDLLEQLQAEASYA